MDAINIEKKPLVLKGRLSAGLLTLLPLISAMFAPELLRIMAIQLNIEINTHFYSLNSILKTGASFLLGIMLYTMIRLSFIKNLMQKINEAHINLT
jgi:hypothetical protein